MHTDLDIHVFEAVPGLAEEIALSGEFLEAFLDERGVRLTALHPSKSGVLYSFSDGNQYTMPEIRRALLSVVD